MTEQTQLAVAEQPQQLITIEPAKYVALVFESFRKKFDAYKAEADNVTFDITTAAGMKTAVEWRAKFRDEIRIACENARKERKAPILEIGRLLDGKAKEIAEEVAPYESRFDSAIKAEEARKEAEKQAKAEAERVRVNTIRVRIDEMRTIPSAMVGKTAEHIARCIEGVEKSPVTLEEFQEFVGECEMAKVATLDKLREILSAQQAHEAEQKRIAEERAELERLRAEAAERERIAAAERAEQERVAQVAREAEEARLRQEREAHEAELRKQREAAEAKLRAEREAAEAALRAQREELARQQAAIDRQRAEAERVERERLAAIETEAKAKREAEAAEQARKEREAREAAAAEAREQARRIREDFELNGPHPSEIAELVALNWRVEQQTALNWLCRHVWAEVEVTA
ncbi:hypothetical protein WCQ02_31290 [Paraburkholderia tropica]|uniref:hypothetical protein n=1 Tax=Paraburkholderia tropica TaxID=92647 RepID=UPI003017B925